MTYDQILSRLVRVGTEDTIVRLTFWEGMTINSIADMLQDANVCSAKEFRTYLSTADLNYSFLDGVPKDEKRFYKLEGYIFPDTYEFIGGKESVRKQIGMAVPCRGAQIIFEAILRCFAGIDYETTEARINE